MNFDNPSDVSYTNLQFVNYVIFCIKENQKGAMWILTVTRSDGYFVEFTLGIGMEVPGSALGQLSGCDSLEV